MNPNDPKHPWSRLVAAARRAPDGRDTTAPYGFATRVVALAFAQERRTSFFERFALRAVGVSCLLALLSVAVNYAHLPATTRSVAIAAVEEEPGGEDAVSLLLTTD